MDGTRVYTSEIPPFHLQLLLFWAFVDRKTKTTLAKDILVARAEANIGVIDRKLADTADLYEVTLPFLQRLIYLADGAGVSVSQLHKLLAEGFEDEDLGEKLKLNADELASLLDLNAPA
jgi:hypothetical protein